MCIRDRAYADEIDIMGRSENDVKKAFTVSYNSAEEMRLRVNVEKTKPVIVKQRRTCDPSPSH